MAGTGRLSNVCDSGLPHLPAPHLSGQMTCMSTVSDSHSVSDSYPPCAFVRFQLPPYDIPAIQSRFRSITHKEKQDRTVAHSMLTTLNSKQLLGHSLNIIFGAAVNFIFKNIYQHPSKIV